MRTPDRKRQKRVCHINMLKAYNSREAAESLTTEGKSEAVFPVGVVCETSPSVEQENADLDGFLESDAPLLSARLSNSETLGNLSNVLGHLDDDQRQDVVELLDKFPSILGDAPTLTNVLQHDIVVSNAQPIKQHPYRVNTVKRSIMKQETQYLLEKGLAKPSISPWSSPCLLVQKSDGTKRFCTDYRRVNAVTIPDCFPMPRMEDCVDSVGSAKFVSKLDLLKGYWQVPLTARASEISAFVTPDCFLQFNVMAFGLRNAAATFQRLVNLVLADVPNVNAYLDDLIVYSQSWPEHVSLLQTVFERLERAFLTLNLSKCEIGKATVTYLGKQVGEGQVRPLTAKITAISEFPAPRTRRELRRFLGMAGYYRCFCRNFSSVAVPLTALLELETGIVPQNLKVARVIPIFKTGDSKEFSNYRPISILPCISKILERLVFSRLLNHLDANNILYKHQYGFRKRHSTEHALIQLVNYISSALDNKKFALGVFLDLSKAFDTVSHNILIAKLSRYGVEDVALRWFRSYLANREQYVYLEGYTSMKSQIMIGVPQGSILGPLLFLIYINDMAMTCTKLLPVLFADDTNLVASHQDFNILIKTVNEELSYIVEWFQWNKLTLNIKKCNFMIFCNTNKHYPIELSKIFINDTQIELVQHTRFLGVIIDSGLKWSNHIKFVSKRSAKMLGILRRVCPLVHSSAFLTLYYSFLFPFINYCNIVWAATYPTYLKKLIVIQKKYLRFISHSNRYAPSAPLYNKFKVLPIDKVNIYQTCLLMHKFIYRKQDLPDSFQSLFTPISHVHSFQTRHSNNNLLLPYTRTTRHQFNISFRGPKLWSDLSPSLRSMSSYSAFKKHLKRLLLLA